MNHKILNKLFDYTQVLTANIASLFDLYGVEKGLEHFRSSSRLNFLHFRYYLLQEVFITLSNTTTLADIRNFESKIEEVSKTHCFEQSEFQLKKISFVFR